MTPAEALKRQIDALRESERVQQQEQIAMQAANERRQAWFASTPGARENRDALGRFHHAALECRTGRQPAKLFRFFGSATRRSSATQRQQGHMGKEMQERAERSRTPEPPPRPSSGPYPAPVSRDRPDAHRRLPRAKRSVKLTPQEVEMARVAGISVEEYARQKQKLQAMRATGEYSEQDQRR